MERYQRFAGFITLTWLSAGVFLLGCGQESPDEGDPSLDVAGTPNNTPADANGQAATGDTLTGNAPTMADTTTGSGQPGTAPRPPGGEVMGGLIVEDEPASSPDGNDLTDDTACESVSLETEPVETEVEVPMEVITEHLLPVAMYIVLDNSGSMGRTDGGAETKWDQAVDALSSFVSDSSSEGLDVALKYFNPPGSGGFQDPEAELCDGSEHSAPEVAMALLPDNAQAIVDSLADTRPDGFTPTVGALTGGSLFCQDFLLENPDEPCVVILVTDGQPSGCGLDDCGGTCVDPGSLDLLEPIATEAAQAGVLVYTVGMAGVSDEGFDLLDTVARAGGSDCTPGAAGDETCDVSESGTQGLLDALNSIRDTVQTVEIVTETMTVIESTTLPCTWSVPEPPNGLTFDPGLVNVALTQGGETNTLAPVSSEAECGADGGWYYDNNDDPTQILACEASCQVIESGEGSIDILFGCATETLDPK